MLSNRRAAALFVILLFSIPGVSQTKASTARAAKPAPSRVFPDSNQKAENLDRATSSLQPQPSGQAMSGMPSPAPTPLKPSTPGAQGLPTQPSGTVAVNYRDGMLSVVADKAELGKVLQLVGGKIGTSIEVAPEISAEPVIAHLGPAPPTQVLAQLLDGPQLEYIVMGSDENGHILNRVVVRRRSSFARQPLVAIKAPSAVPQTGPSK